MTGSSVPVRAGRLLSACVLSILLCACAPEAEHAAPVAGQLRLGAVLGAADLAGFRRADGPRDFAFPEDHGAHADFRSEWWYLTLLLDDESGADVGAQFTLFRQALTPAPEEAANRWLSNQVYLAHFAVTDTVSGQHRALERFARGHPALAGVRAEPFALWLEDWRLEETRLENGLRRWRLRAGDSAMSIDVVLEVDAEPVLQGAAGLSRKGPDQASYYFSMPRLPVSGEVVVAGEARRVRGLGWLDREWSTSVLAEAQVGWDWFALQLDDGRSVMAFQLRRQDGSRDPYDQGLVVAADGSTRSLGTSDFRLTPTRFWKDREGVGWPVAWTVRIGAEAWQVEAVLDDQAMNTTIRYWEGMVSVRSESGEQIGRGYLELTGYGS